MIGSTRRPIEGAKSGETIGYQENCTMMGGSYVERLSPAADT